jgi:kynurenine formamidase
MSEPNAAQSLDARIVELGARLSNWGRWGRDDELGTLNHISDRVRAEAAGSIRTGQVISLALELRGDQPQPAGSGRRNIQHFMTETGTDAAAAGGPVGWADDAIAMSVHAATHWDALSHVFHRGLMYNERPADLVTAAGAEANDILPVARSMAARGVLVDVAAHRGLPALAPDHEISVAELEAAIDAQGVEVRRGDVLLIRTGHLGRIRAAGAWETFTEVNGVMPREPGIGLDCLAWIHEHGIAAVASDNWAVEHLAGPEVTRLPVHEVGLVHMGLPLGEVFELDGLASACADDRRYDFLLAAGPLPISGGVGGPVNPLAIR